MFAEDLAASVSEAVSSIAGAAVPKPRDTKPERARAWFINSYPLLGALAASFEMIDDPAICQRLGISIAAVDEYSREIYVNPAAGLSAEECRFVIAHELLHVGLRHHDRRQGRHPFLWNVACDFVINAWLIEMGVGLFPVNGGLYNPVLKGESGEAIYDRIVQDVRRYRKIATLAGFGVGDILERRPKGWSDRDTTNLDDFCRRCLIQGLEYHQAQARGFLPAGLIEEIRALSHPPSPGMWSLRTGSIGILNR
ncbi:MAG: vWA domain-containing protein [Gammaproteobacteria bacterium]